MGDWPVSSDNRPRRHNLKTGDHILLRPEAAFSGPRSAAVAAREGKDLTIAQFGTGERVDRTVQVSDVTHVLLDCDCVDGMPCLQRPSGSTERCSIWMRVVGD